MQYTDETEDQEVEAQEALTPPSMLTVGVKY
jgi:hypothetical protein